MNDSVPHPDHPEPPERLRDDLASLYATGAVRVPSRVDDAVLNRARAELARPRMTRNRRRLLAWAGTAAAAACALLALRTALLDTSPDAPDIVDALRLAHQIQQGKGRDVNGDGATDQRDVDAIAMRVVRLEGGVQ